MYSCHMIIDEHDIMYASLPSEGFPNGLCISWSDATDHIWCISEECCLGVPYINQLISVGQCNIYCCHV